MSVKEKGLSKNTYLLMFMISLVRDGPTRGPAAVARRGTRKEFSLEDIQWITESPLSNTITPNTPS